ncbi:flagellin N-terminal helical domain-containing protein [Carnobacterium antarcticum]|uniref:Flagellin n=1 Tax=Carnobacterium antarcticum TaxID=2126436 RepID=A0ABW4NKG7_9LACT|nr:flagellin [Carnobacterium sp. CP1]ALV22053.1 Flagellin protein FlaA [Carnobacterium sp. CP1]
MRINTNTAAANTYSRLNSANASKANSLAKLSSGLRINKAGDDAAGLSISEKMKNQISGLTQATRNAQDGISLIQTAEGALNETHSILNRMRDLSVQASNDTNSVDDRSAIDAEMEQLSTEIDRISSDTKFNGISLLSGKRDLNIQIGANSSDKALTIQTVDASFAGIAVTAQEKTAITDAVDALTVMTDPKNPTAGELTALAEAQETDSKASVAAAHANVDRLDNAIKTVSDHRATFGAQQNRLDHTINNLTTSKENLSEANSRIRDVDMAEEMMNFTKSNILSSAATSMLAQANQMPQSVLQLLQ